MKRWMFFVLLGMMLLTGCFRSGPAATATAPIEMTPTVTTQQLEAESRALASESNRLWLDGEYSQALAVAVKAVHKTYSTPETCGTVVEEAKFALVQAMFSSELPDVALSEHVSDVRTATFSPDGKRIVTVSSKDAKVWDAATGQLLQNLKAHLYSVESAVFSPDGSLVLTASDDASAKVWDAATGEILLSLNAHDYLVWSAVFSPDGDRIATASEDGTAKVWDAATGELLHSLRGDGYSVVQVAFSPDGSQLLTASSDRAYVWDAVSGQQIFRLDGHAYDVFSAAYNPSGDRIVTASLDGSAKVWDAATGALLHSLDEHTGIVFRAAFSPDGLSIVTASADGSAKVWDAGTGQLLNSLDGHEKGVEFANFSPDGRFIATAGADHIFKVWDAATGKLLHTLDGKEGYSSFVAFSPDSSRILIPGWDGSARVWSLDRSIPGMLDNAKARLAGLLSPEEFAAVYDEITTCVLATAPVITPQATTTASIVAASATPTQKPPSPTPEKEAATATLEIITPSPVSFKEDGMFLYGATVNDEDHIYALQPGGRSRFITKGIMLYGQAISPDGTKVVVDANPLSQRPPLSENVFIFDVETGETFPFNFLGVPPFKVFWSADGSFILYVARYDEVSPAQLVVYDVISGENRVLVEMEKILLTSGWSVDGQTIAYVADVEGQYDLFTINSETLEQQQLTDNIDIETMVLWSPTAPQLLVGTVIDEMSAFEDWPWGVENLYLFGINNSHSRLLMSKWLTSESVSWSPDGKQIALWNEGLLCIKNLETMTEVCPLTNISPFDEFIVSFDTRPIWSAEGDWTAFYAINMPCMMIYFLELETNSTVLGDLGCDVTEISRSSPIYWSQADIPETSD